MKNTGNNFPWIVIFLIILLCIISSTLNAKQLSRLETDTVSVYYDEPQALAARQVIQLYPIVKAELETTLTWKVDFKPAVLLAPDRKTFASMAGSPLIVAYAVPEKMLIVIDFSRMNTAPFTLATTLNHEMCHLLLHRYIQATPLPRWLDEGVCQWASGGLSELVTGNRRSALAWDSLSGGFIPLNSLSLSFPQDEQSLALAYEESKSVVEYIISSFGKKGLLDILNAMKNKEDVSDAVSLSLGMSIEGLDKRWQASQRSWTVVIAALAANLYTILFVFGALLTLAIYMRLIIRKRRFRDEEEDEKEPSLDS
jgi:hypothetical protein